MENPVDFTFEQVISRNKSKIFRICTIYAVAPLEPEDLFQEVVFHIYKALPHFNYKANINTWVYRISLNVCMRMKSKQEKSNFNSIRLDSIEYQIPSNTPDQAIKERIEALYACIRSLNEIDRSIAILVLDELSYQEIAEITKLTENHIAVKMKRMKKVLMNCINTKLR